MLGLVGKVIGSVFGGGKVTEMVTKGVAHVAHEIDESKLTDEEKAKLHARNVEQFVSWQRQELNESTTKARSRKTLALIITYGTLLMLLASAILYRIDDSYSSYLYLMARDWMRYPFLAVIGYYFGIHLLDRRK